MTADNLNLEDISYLMQLYSNTRYPKGDHINEFEAKKSLAIANKIFNDFK